MINVILTHSFVVVQVVAIGAIASHHSSAVASAIASLAYGRIFPAERLDANEFNIWVMLQVQSSKILQTSITNIELVSDS